MIEMRKLGLPDRYYALEGIGEQLGAENPIHVLDVFTLWKFIKLYTLTHALFYTLYLYKKAYWKKKTKIS